MYNLNESEHIRDRSFKISWRLNKKDGIGSCAESADGIDERIRVNLKEAAERDLPILSGDVSYRQRVDAWKDSDGKVTAERFPTCVYEGVIPDPGSEEALVNEVNRITHNVGWALQSPKAWVSVDAVCWIVYPCKDGILRLSA